MDGYESLSILWVTCLYVQQLNIETPLLQASFQTRS
jgi:hypothetical protein